MKRLDGRKTDEVRNIKIQLGLCTQADGSAYIHQGGTKVLALVYGPHEVRSGKDYKALNSGAVLYCQFSRMISSRSGAKEGVDDKAAQMVRQAFESSVITSVYPRTQIDVFIKVMQSDGSDVSASINAASLALSDAGIQMKGLVCSCACGQVAGARMVDPTLEEEKALGGEVNLYALLPFTDQLVMLQTDDCGVDMLEREGKEAGDAMQLVRSACKRTLLYLSDAIKTHHIASNKHKV